MDTCRRTVSFTTALICLVAAGASGSKKGSNPVQEGDVVGTAACSNQTCSAASRGMTTEAFEALLDRFGRSESQDGLGIHHLSEATVFRTRSEFRVQSLAAQVSHYDSTSELTLLGRKLAVSESMEDGWVVLNDSAGSWRRESWSEDGKVLAVYDERGRVLKVEYDDAGRRVRVALGNGDFAIAYEYGDHEFGWTKKWVEGPNGGALWAIAKPDAPAALNETAEEALARPTEMFEYRLQTPDGPRESVAELRAGRLMGLLRTTQGRPYGLFQTNDRSAELTRETTQVRSLERQVFEFPRFVSGVYKPFSSDRVEFSDSEFVIRLHYRQYDNPDLPSYFEISVPRHVPKRGAALVVPQRVNGPTPTMLTSTLVSSSLGLDATGQGITAIVLGQDASIVNC